jgi:hypothetical protein
MRCVEGDGTEPRVPTAKRSPSVFLCSLLRDAAGVRAVPPCRPFMPSFCAAVARRPCRRPASAACHRLCLPVSAGGRGTTARVPVVRGMPRCRPVCRWFAAAAPRGGRVRRHARPPRAAARSRTSSSRGGSVTKGCPAPRITRGRAVPARPAGPGAAGPRHASARQRRAPRSTGAVRRGRPRSRPASGSCTGPGRRRSVTCGGRAQGCGAGRTTANGSAVPVVCRAGCRGHRLTP